jgi:hypothetical protein
MGSKVAGTMKEHPLATAAAAAAAAAAAGVGVLLTKGLRKGAGAGSRGSDEADAGEDEQDERPEEEGEEGKSEMSGDEGEDEADDEGDEGDEGDDDAGDDEGGGTSMTGKDEEEDEEDEGEEEGEEQDEDEDEGEAVDEGESEGEEEEEDDERADDEDDEEEDSRGGGGRGFRARLGEGISSLGSLGRNGLSRVGSALRGGAEAVGDTARSGARAVGRGARGEARALGRSAQTGFDRGRDAAGRNWQDHPLLLCAAALAAGVAVGLMLPPTDAEDNLMGETSDRLTGRANKAARDLWGQGRDVAGRAIREAVDTTTREIEKEGLSPDRLGKKVRRVASQVREAVANAVQED